MIIAVIGGTDATTEGLMQAEAVGREIAQRGAVLICGGLGGVMECACRGARSASGTTVGVLPGTDALGANEYVAIPIVTGMGQARNAIIVQSAGAVIAIGGGFGTLSEIAFALRLGKSLVGLGTWSMQYDGDTVRFPMLDDPAAAVALAISLATPEQGVTRYA